jgi:hypothetical protein
MNRTVFLITLLVFAINFCSFVEATEPNENLYSMIDRYIAADNSASSKGNMELMQSIIDQIEKSGSAATSGLLKKIDKPNEPEKTLAVYVWAIGYTKDPIAADKLIRLHKTSKSEMVKWSSLRSLARIKTPQAEKYLLSVAKTTPDKFSILDLLAEMQYEKALPETYTILKNIQYWQTVFIFGKMGDVSIPYLLNQINDPNGNVRGNSVQVLGYTLLALKAAEPMEKRYWVEKDAEIKRLILSSLERIMPNLAEMESFFKQVAAKENNAELKKFAQETMDNIGRYQQMADEFKAKKKTDPQSFEKEYTAIYKSAGHEGDIEKLGACSTIQDENRLKKLREHILTGNSDECFNEYDKINTIIMLNRLAVQNSSIPNIQKEKP